MLFIYGILWIIESFDSAKEEETLSSMGFYFELYSFSNEVIYSSILFVNKFFVFLIKT